MFEVFTQGGGQCWFRLTRQAEQQYLDEQTLKGDLESILVDKVRDATWQPIPHGAHIGADIILGWC